jgi:hypothetical protein
MVRRAGRNGGENLKEQPSRRVLGRSGNGSDAGPTIGLPTGATMETAVQLWLSRFGLDAFLHAHVAGVLIGLPEHVRQDVVTDGSFRFFDYEPGPGAMHVPVGVPGPNGAGRSVVLKRTLRRRPEAFVRYIIAHELAHAHLRNRGRFPGDDPEHAADALAAEWGFPRPVM